VLKWLSRRDTFSTTLTSKLSAEHGGMCNGISAGTCCDTDMFEGIAKLWNNEVKSENYSPKVYFGTMKDLMENRVPFFLEYARKQFPIVKKLWKKYSAVKTGVYKSFKFFAQGTVPWSRINREYRASAIKCSAFMQNISKGSLCAICDRKEWKRYTNETYVDSHKRVIKIVKVSKIDTFNFANACHSHLKNSDVWFKLFRRMMALISYKYPRTADKLRANLPSKELLRSSHKSILSLAKCKEDMEKCNSTSLRGTYMIGPITRFENKWSDFAKLLQKTVAGWGVGEESQKKLLKLWPIIERRRILLSVKVVKERDWRWITNTDDYASFKFWKKQVNNTSYRMEKDETKLNGVTSNFDNKMPIMPLEKLLFFTSHSHCPLATVYGGWPTPSARARSPGPMKHVCGDLKSTCCKRGTFRGFKLDSRIAKTVLKSYYRNWFRANMFLLGGVVENLNYKPGDPALTNCHGPIEGAKCDSLMLNMKRALFKANKYKDRYRKSFVQCYGYVERLRNRLRCASCDPKSNKWMNHKSGKIVLKREVVNKVIKKCYDADLYEHMALRGVYQAFLNYGRQIDSTLSMTNKILYK